jgi:hypothetical protein
VCCTDTRTKCPVERIRDLASAYEYVILPKRIDPAALGDGWSLAAAPENSYAFVYSADRRRQARQYE